MKDSINKKKTTKSKIPETAAIVPKISLIQKIDNLSEEVIGELLVKYQQILELLNKNENPKHLAFIFEATLGYVRSKSVGVWSHIAVDSLADSFIVVRKLFEKNIIEYENQIGDELDKYFTYYDENYKLYSAELVWSYSEYDGKMSFINRYLENRYKKETN